MKLSFVFLAVSDKTIVKEMLLQHIHDGVYNLPITKESTVRQVFDELIIKFDKQENKERLLALKEFMAFNEEHHKDDMDGYYNTKFVNPESPETEFYLCFYFDKVNE